MNDSDIKKVIDEIDIPAFLIGLQGFRMEVQEKIDADPDYDGQADELLECLDRLQALLNSKKSMVKMSVEKNRELFSAFTDYFRYHGLWQGHLNQISESDDEEYDEDEDGDEYEVRELEDIDVEEFKVELAEFKNMLLDAYKNEAELTTEEEQGKKEQLELIERLQVAFYEAHSLDDFNAEELEAIRPDFDYFEEFTNELIASMEDDGDFDEDDEDSDFDGPLQLEEIDVVGFRMELAGVKDCILKAGEQGIIPFDAADAAVMKEQLILIDRLQNFFSKRDSLDDYNEQELEAIRPDFDLYMGFSDALFSELESLDMEFSEFEDTECDEESKF
jgi:hypothetical protein